ncbi:hypothetical protein Nepgr_018055 [Nepenthes gracilis]|uniref:Uncharacterized protein n=1 Tax=Nepenthes gracilis TaxID=150966 RepID=A0AAD3XTP4_NEPGR|nr:hypothetical protein Nepgr_018055 [Nepenthes gracilis]
MHYSADNSPHAMDNVLPTANSFATLQYSDKVCSSNGLSAKALVSISSPCEHGRLPIIETPTATNATTTMPPTSDMKPMVTSIELGLLNGRPKNILTSFEARVSPIQEMDNRN